MSAVHRGHARKFDWDEARRLREEGLTYAAIALRLGVSETAVGRVVGPDRFERRKEAARLRSLTGVCDDCGGPMNKFSRYHGSRRCTRCAVIARGTTARDGELQCYICREWKSDDLFPANRSENSVRRGRHAVCRACGTIARREYRNRNKVPCAGGCGRLVLAPNEQRASAKSKGYRATGRCRSCACFEVQARLRAQREGQRA